MTVVFRDQRRQVTARHGRWRVSLAAMPAGTGDRLVVESGGHRLTISDVAVGEVWVLAGQSNMEFALAAADGGSAAVAAAGGHDVGMFSVTGDIRDARWAQLDPRNAGRSSAVGYFFALALQRALGGVPIGLVQGPYGGTPIPRWTTVGRGVADGDL